MILCTVQLFWIFNKCIMSEINWVRFYSHYAEQVIYLIFKRHKITNSAVDRCHKCIQPCRWQFVMQTLWSTKMKARVSISSSTRRCLSHAIVWYFHKTLDKQTLRSNWFNSLKASLVCWWSWTYRKLKNSQMGDLVLRTMALYHIIIASKDTTIRLIMLN